MLFEPLFDIMKTFNFIIFATILSCNTIKPLPKSADISDGSFISTEMNQFLLAFEKKVKGNKKVALIEFIDTDYKMEQLGNLNGNMEQFINELFYGTQIPGGKFTNILLSEIDEIKLIEMQKVGSDLYRATYEIKSAEIKIKVKWDIRNAKNNPISGFGFIGAYG